MSSLQRKIHQTGLPPRPTMTGVRTGPGNLRKKKDYSAIHWSKHFNEKRYVKLENGNSFCVYEGGMKKSGDEVNDKSNIPVLILLHGGGFSGLTWAELNTYLSMSVECRVFALDLRGHGESATRLIEDEFDLSAEVLSNDVIEIADKLLGDTSPPVIIVGHSMGGALAVHTALLNESYSNYEETGIQRNNSKACIQNLVGVCVIDVVEGTAMEALSSMQSFLRSRPRTFPSIEYAIEWAVRSGQVRNLDSARVSMPGQLKDVSTGICSTQCVALEQKAKCISVTEVSNITPILQLEQRTDSIVEESEENENISSQEKDEHPIDDKFKHPQDESPAEKKSSLTWRVDLCKSEPHWKSWFEGLSSKFLSVSASKLLLLAGVDRLDRDLTVGQMQGKFQMQILPQAGHAVHEDVPEKVADILSTFLVRNKFAKPLDNFNRTFPAC